MLDCAGAIEGRRCGGEHTMATGVWAWMWLSTSWKESAKRTKAVCVGGSHGTRVTGRPKREGSNLKKAWRLYHPPSLSLLSHPVIHPELEPSTKASCAKESRVLLDSFPRRERLAVFPFFGHLKSHSCAPLAYHGRQQAGQDGESQPLLIPLVCSMAIPNFARLAKPRKSKWTHAKSSSINLYRSTTA